MGSKWNIGRGVIRLIYYYYGKVVETKEEKRICRRKYIFLKWNYGT